MAFQNTVVITGNVTRDPELQTTASGKQVLTIGIAYNRSRVVDGKRVNGDGEFFNVVAWNELATNIASSVVKGTRINVVGRLQWRQYTPEGEDKPRSVVEILAEEVGVDLRFATVAISKVAANGAAREDVPAPSDEEYPY
jgi:single-strand DNA-binding protein